MRLTLGTDSSMSMSMSPRDPLLTTSTSLWLIKFSSSSMLSRLTPKIERWTSCRRDTQNKVIDFNWDKLIDFHHSSHIQDIGITEQNVAHSDFCQIGNNKWLLTQTRLIIIDIFIQTRSISSIVTLLSQKQCFSKLIFDYIYFLWNLSLCAWRKFSSDGILISTSPFFSSLFPS